MESTALKAQRDGLAQPAKPNKPPLKVVVVGAGYFAQFQLEAWQRLRREGLVELLGVIDSDPTRRKTATENFSPDYEFVSVQQMFETVRPDLIDIATPPATHLELVSLAAEHKIDCIVQKPLAPDLTQARAVVESAQLAGIRLVVHENFRWMPWYQEMKRFLDAELLGTPHTISVRLRPGDGQGPEAYLARQPYFQQMPRFLVHETAIHFVDTFRYLFGEVVAVTARLRRINPVISGEDAGYIVLEFANGLTALIDGNRLNDHSGRNARLTMGEHWLEGSKGVMRLDGDGGLFFKPHGQTERIHNYRWRNLGFGGDCVFQLQQQIVHDVLAGTPSINSGADYLRNVVIEEAIYESNEQGKTVYV